MAADGRVGRLHKRGEEVHADLLAGSPEHIAPLDEGVAECTQVAVQLGRAASGPGPVGLCARQASNSGKNGYSSSSGRTVLTLVFELFPYTVRLCCLWNHTCGASF